MNLQEFSTKRAFQTRNAAGRRELQSLEKNLPCQRITVGVQTSRWQSNDCIARVNAFPIQHVRSLDDANNCPADIIFARLIKPRHLRRLPADQRAIVFRASPGESFDYLRESAGLQPPGAYVIQEKKRLSAKHRDVIHTMIHQVLTDCAMPIHLEGNFELCSHAIDAR